MTVSCMTGFHSEDLIFYCVIILCILELFLVSKSTNKLYFSVLGAGHKNT
jgi:hypothetical protein